MSKSPDAPAPASNAAAPSNPARRKLKPSTLMMSHGYEPRLSEGALKPPIFLTSTYVFESAEAGKRHFERVTGRVPGGVEGLVYGRFNGPDQEILEDRLSIWEEAEAALSFGSGMAAISTVLLSMVKPGDVIVHSSPLYAATETLIGKVLAGLGVRFVDFPAGATLEIIAAALGEAQAQGRIAAIFLESPANPTNALVDVEAVRAARDGLPEGGRPLIIIDNTFLGPLWAKPLQQGADIVVYSLTKYVGGHSDLVAGGALGSKAVIQPVRALRNTIGTILDPHSSWMLLRSLETLELRMTRAGESAAKVCTFLRSHPKVERVGYLGFLDPAGRQADIYRRHCSGAGSTFSLYLKGGEREAYAFLDALRIAKLAVSLGGTETLASHPASMTHLSVPDARKAALNIGDNLVRISVGVEDADDIISDLDQALGAA